MSSSSAVPSMGWIELTLLFIQYAFYPNEYQTKGRFSHRYAIYEALSHIIINGIIYGSINYIYGYLYLSHQDNIIWNVGLLIILCCDIIILIIHLTSLRDAIIFDLNIFLWVEEDMTINNFQKLDYSISQYMGYFLYYKHKEQDIKDCPICLYPFDQEMERKLLVCGHSFHSKCIRLYEKKQAKHSKTLCGQSCPICRNNYHQQFEKWTFNPNYYQDKGILYYQPPRDIACVTWNGYKYFPQEMMDYTRNRGKFIINTAFRTLLYILALCSIVCDCSIDIYWIHFVHRYNCI